MSEMTDRIDALFAGIKPPPARRIMDVVRVTTAEGATYVCVSKTFYGVMVHWDGRRTSECKSPKQNKCDGCMRGLSAKWKGYLHVWTPGKKDWQGFLELTETACRQLEVQMANGENMRGIRFKIAKTKGGKKGRYLSEIFEKKCDLGEIPEEVCPYETLSFLWNCKRPSFNVI